MNKKTKKGGGERLVKTLTREELKAKMDRGDDFVLLEALGGSVLPPGALAGRDTASGHRRRG